MKDEGWTCRQRPISRQAIHHSSCRIPRFPGLGKHVPRRPEPAFRVEQAVLSQRLLVAVVDFEQFDVLVADAAGGAGAVELLGPDFQPLQLADEFADQIDQPSGRRDGLEVLQPAAAPLARR